MITRIFAIFMRQFYLYRRTLHRAFNLFYWSTLELFIWGLLTVYLNKLNTGSINFIPIILSGLIFWNLFNRTQQSISVSFLDDVWSRNLGNVFASPIKPLEYMMSLILLGVFQAFITIGLMSSLAGVLWELNIFDLGIYFIPFILNLFIMSCTLGIVTIAIILRLGPSVEILAWSLPMLIQPLSAVVYPVSILPTFLQKVSFALPTSHVFEGMRAVLLEETFELESLLWAFGLNLFYLVLAVLFFQISFQKVRERGLLQRHTD